MNWRQFRAIVWLRWRLAVNRARRSGTFSLIVTSIVLVGAALGSAGLFLVSLIVGSLLLPRADDRAILFLWDGVVLAYLVCWLIELTVELQRGELLSLDKLLHLPASLFDVFLLNYLSSWISFTHLVFLPGMLGLALASVIARGPAQMAIFPALAGFLMLTTALAYQFRGWLAALMSNPRRRRTVVAMLTLGIVLLAQAPNLINLGAHRWRRQAREAAVAQDAEELDQLNAEVQAGRLTREELTIQRNAMLARRAARDEARDEASLEVVVGVARVVNAWLPFGWLPLGADATARGNPWIALWGAAGTGLIAAVSLRRAYRTTIRHVTMAGDSATAGKHPPATSATDRQGQRRLLVERRLPWASEQTSAVAWTALQSYLRATEVRLLLMTPIIVLSVVGATLLFAGNVRPPAGLRPFIGLGVVGMSFLPMIQLFCNQFGFDRAGFRAYVLSCLPRRGILLGKNLALVPLSTGPALVGAIVVQCVAPMTASQFAATLLQLPIVFLAFCLVGNLASILAPFPVAGGTLQPAAGLNAKVMLNAVFALTMPLTLAPSVCALGLELLADYLELGMRLPLYLAGTLIELALLVGLYRLLWERLGTLLQRREQRIMETVTVGLE